uniref:Uncharacterized protein n=1 Tax=Macrostomum lignano TaxID=282301 RepID=A0A1I8FQZ0_9PLAT
MELNVATPVQSGYHLVGLNHCATNSLGRRLGKRPTADPLTKPPRSRCYSTKRSPHSRLRLFRPPGWPRQRQTEAAGFSNCIRTVREPCDFTGQLVDDSDFMLPRRGRGDLVLTRFHDPAAQQRCRGLLAPRATESSSWRRPGQSAGAGRHSARLAHRRSLRLRVVCG